MLGGNPSYNTKDSNTIDFMALDQRVAQQEKELKSLTQEVKRRPFQDPSAKSTPPDSHYGPAQPKRVRTRNSTVHQIT